MRGDRRGKGQRAIIARGKISPLQLPRSLDDERGEKVQQVALLGKVEVTAAKWQRTLLRRDRSIEGYVGGK